MLYNQKMGLNNSIISLAQHLSEHEPTPSSIFNVEGIIPEKVKGLFEKESIAYNARLAKSDVSIVDTLNGNPDSSKADILDKIQSDIPNILENPTDQQFISERLDLLLKRRDTIKTVVEKYETPEQLFKGFFGKEPVGEIQVGRGPFSAYVICFDQEDFNYVVESPFSKYSRGAIADRRMQGCVVKDCLEPEMGFSVACAKSNDLIEQVEGIRNFTTETILEHEDQHIFQWLIRPPTESNIVANIPDPEDFAKGIKGLSDEDLTQELKDYLITIKEFLIEYGDKDELGSYIAEGMSPDEAYIMTETGYDYANTGKEMLENKIGKELSDSQRFLLRGILDNAFADYQPTMLKVLDVANDLKKQGLNNREIAMFLANKYVRQMV